MSTRIHWLRPIDKRITACGRNAFQSNIFEGSAAEYLGVSNFCRVCEGIAHKDVEAQKILAEFGTGKAKLLPAPQWPEPRPIAEAPQTAILAWCPATDELTEGWEVVYPSNQPGLWCGNGELHRPTHFLPLPPAPEVRK